MASQRTNRANGMDDPYLTDSTNSTNSTDSTDSADSTGGTAGVDGAAGAAGVHDGTDSPASGTPVGGATAEDASAAVKAAENAGPSGGESVRVDSWIWSVRLAKTRSAGATACRGGHVRVNGERVKPAYALRLGDEVRLRQETRERVVVVKRLIRKRVGAPVAVQCYVDNSPPPPPREAVAPAGVRDRGAGRPTKRDRRDMERLRGDAERARGAGDRDGDH
jgi:ribosome-associated heat shock protein Hsp15